MPYKQKSASEKILENLYSLEAVHLLTADEMKVKERYSFAVSSWLDDPIQTDKMIVNLLVNHFGISVPQAYRDISVVKIYLGSLKNANKEWARWMMFEGLKDCIKRAKESEKLAEEIMAYDKIGKYFKLDKDEDEPLPWDELIPPQFELSDDVTVLDKKLSITDLEAKRAKLREKYGKATDAEFED